MTAEPLPCLEELAIILRLATTERAALPTHSSDETRTALLTLERRQVIRVVGQSTAHTDYKLTHPGRRLYETMLPALTDLYAAALRRYQEQPLDER